LADSSEGVAARDEGAHVRAATQALRDHLRSDVEPDRAASTEEVPAVAGVDDRAAPGRDHAGQLRSGVGGPEPLDRDALAAPEPGLALACEQVRDSRARLFLDLPIEVDERRAVTRRNSLPDGRFAASG